MDAKSTKATIEPWPKKGLSEHVRAAPEPVGPRPSREEAEAAVRTLIAFAGDDPAPFVPAFPGLTSNLPGLDEAASGLQLRRGFEIQPPIPGMGKGIRCSGRFRPFNTQEFRHQAV